MNIFKKGILISLFLCIAHSTAAEQMKSLGNWDVHYIAFTSTFLTPDIARAYGISRSRYNGVVNISILDHKTQAAQALAVTGEATNLLGVSKKLEFKEIREQQAIYYLAVIPFREGEQYRLKVNLQQGNRTETLKFQHKFMVE